MAHFWSHSKNRVNDLNRNQQKLYVIQETQAWSDFKQYLVDGQIYLLLIKKLKSQKVSSSFLKFICKWYFPNVGSVQALWRCKHIYDSINWVHTLYYPVDPIFMYMLLSNTKWKLLFVWSFQRWRKLKIVRWYKHTSSNILSLWMMPLLFWKYYTSQRKSVF